jgi:uncharacterized protein
MILDLREFESFPVMTSIHGDPQTLGVNFDSVLGVTRVSLDLDIQEVSEEYICRGTVYASVNLECARCLESFAFDLSQETDFIARGEKVETDPRVTDDEDYVLLEKGDKVGDLTPIVRQAIILSVGLKPVCDSDCKGLCPVCGINRNRKDCDCETETIDPRWDGLKQLANSSETGSDSKEG